MKETKSWLFETIKEIDKPETDHEKKRKYKLPTSGMEERISLVTLQK